MLTPMAISMASSEGRALLAALRDRFQSGEGDCAARVTEIIERVKKEGDAALLDYTRRFDAPEFTLEQLRVSDEEFAQAEAGVDAELAGSLRLAAGRIRAFHEREVENSWIMTRDDGAVVGRLVRPVDAAGLYVPGGRGGSTPLVSSVLMNGIPAAIAGVPRRVMVTPPDVAGRVNPALLLAAREVGIHEVYKLGSAWAIAALAWGTGSVPRVDVVVGPGNQYVAEAKRQVMGRVRIDMLAGPSEVLVLADESADPASIAADMLAQAEHDPQALALCLSTSREVAEAAAAELARQLPRLARADIARAALEARGRILVVERLETAIDMANEIAIEHLELLLADPWQWLPRIRHAGAIFLGPHTPEAAGDYTAGPNHVLPTMGTARIASALGVETFIKKSSVIAYSQAALAADAPHIRRIAGLEGLSAHARSVTVRIDGDA